MIRANFHYSWTGDVIAAVIIIGVILSVLISNLTARLCKLEKL